MIEKEVLKIGYGQLTFNVVIKNGKALIRTMRVTRSKKKRYPLRQRDVVIEVSKLNNP